MTITTVGGLEMNCMPHPHPLDTSPALLSCPFCGHEGAFHDSGNLSTQFNRWAECSNTSCGVRTPEHYQTREAVARAWNRRTSNTEAK
jgi:hypothetical protein